MKGSHLYSYLTLCSRGYPRSRDKLQDLPGASGDLPWGVPTHKVTWPFEHVFLRDHMTNWRHNIFTTTMSIPTQLIRVLTYHEGLPPVKTHNPLITWSCKITWQAKNILLSQCPWLTKLGRVLTHHEGLSLIKSHDPLSTWSWVIMWQNKPIISPTMQCLSTPNLVGWWLTVKGTHS